MEALKSWCFFTTFVCEFDLLDEAKMRHQRCVDVLREQYHVHFSSEQAYNAGPSEPIFSLLLSEIVGHELNISEGEKDKYSTFVFVTVVDVPYSPKGENDEMYKVSRMLEIDFEEGFPAKFPSRTRGIMVSSSGHEREGCIFQ